MASVDAQVDDALGGRLGAGHQANPTTNWLLASDFALFDLPERFAQDLGEIDARWKALQRSAHPDQHSAQGDSAARAAAQMSARINQAHARLKAPLARAAYLCELRGAPIQAENNTAMPAAFLMQQMAWREALDEACSEQELDSVKAMSSAYGAQLLQRAQQLLDVDSNPQAAAEVVRQWLFVDKFNADLAKAFDRLDA